ncbi:MAG: hypothetical protein DWQ37_00995 [Planctomycetota bacterium]|nr:MAG: hypothetical protein DWQ37_00995 [Planctomycetota bacterium]
MSLADLYRALELIAANPDQADFAGPQPETRVAQVQSLLQLKFPPSYLEFVTRLGCGNLGSAEFYGVVSDDPVNSSIPDGVWATLTGREDSGRPPQYLVVGETGDGAEYVIDTSRRNDADECPVLEWWPSLPEASGNGVIVAEDFGAYFLHEVEEALARETK